MTTKKAPEGFDVTVSQVIGRVEFTGEDPPLIAAAHVIYQHQSVTNEPASYQFPSEYGGKVTVENGSDYVS